MVRNTLQKKSFFDLFIQLPLFELIELVYLKESYVDDVKKEQKLETLCIGH